MIAIINKVAPMGDAWYMQTFCNLTAPLACVMVSVGVYWERNDVNKQKKLPICFQMRSIS